MPGRRMGVLARGVGSRDLRPIGPRTVCQSQKSLLHFNGIFGGSESGKPIDDKGFSLFPRECQ